MVVFFIIILLASLFEYIGDSNLKFYAINNNKKNLLYGIIGYILVIITIIYVLRYTNVMYMNLYWDSVSIILETLLAYIILKEKLDNYYQYGGLIMIIIGIILLNVGNIPK
jgi:multidrug transporter EmrE-like cation transporter